MSVRWPLALAIAWSIPLGSLAAERTKIRPLTPQEADFVEKKIRPLLLDSCGRCHGEKKQMGGLRLDSRLAFLKGGDSGPAIVPGNPKASLLIHAVRHSGDIKMPPKVEDKLKPDAIDALAVWIEMGAPLPDTKITENAEAWKRHWAFLPIANPPMPAVEQQSWPRTSVDRFILAKLEAHGLSPSPQADRRTLIRRATFDLIGLPPTPEEIASFESDPAPEAFARVVDRLLASPHYGERWGRYWLDVARFADTKGYVFLQDTVYPWAHTYRDYIIRAFNEDLPYDQFVLQQLAADKLPLGADHRPLAGLGFLTLGGRFMNNVQDTLDDRIDVVTRGLMGLTVTCARCHDHKFDPIPTKDYYALYGVFASSVEPAVPPLFEPPPQSAAYATFQKEMAVREQKLADFVQTKFTALLASSKARAGDYLMAAQQALNQPNPEQFMLIADGADLNPTMISRWRAFLDRTRKGHDAVVAPWHALAGVPPKEFANKAKELTIGWTMKPDAGKTLNALVVKALATNPPTTLAAAAQRYGEVFNQIDKLWQEAQRRGLPRLSDPAQEQIRQVFHGPGAAPNLKRELISDLELLPDRASQGKLQELVKSVEQYRISGPGAPSRAHSLVDSAVPYSPRVFLRGNPNQLGAAAPRRMPAVVAGAKREPFRNGSGRLELAQGIVSRDNPLTARVMVNRVWLHHFGNGLVRTPGDFGMRGDPPSHPELLDHLATTFMSHGWSVKELHRLIMLSAVYQQRGDDRPECAKVDPENFNLWRMERRRLDFEAMRDALLAASGRLNRTVGGPSIREILAPAATRRTLYGFVDRQYTPGLFRAFDFPSPDAMSPQRDTTTIPQQALFMMNNPLVIECAKSLLHRPDVARIEDVGERIARMYLLCYGRGPNTDELALARAFTAEGTAANWERYAQALLEANEFVFVD